jgi:hypothetical protein
MLMEDFTDMLMEDFTDAKWEILCKSHQKGT